MRKITLKYFFIRPAYNICFFLICYHWCWWSRHLRKITLLNSGNCRCFVCPWISFDWPYFKICVEKTKFQRSWTFSKSRTKNVKTFANYFIMYQRLYFKYLYRRKIQPCELNSVKPYPLKFSISAFSMNLEFIWYFFVQWFQVSWLKSRDGQTLTT